MRTLWNVVSFVAIVNLLALLMVVAWLWQTKRLTVERVRDAKLVFAQTLPEAQEAANKTASLAQEEQIKQSEAARLANPPMDSATQIKYVSLVRQQEAQSRQRMADDQKTLLKQLEKTGSQLEERRAALAKQKATVEDADGSDQKRKIDEQFMQTVKQYELALPKQAKKMIQELVDGGNQEQAVAYLKTMNPRAASKILREFKTDPEIALAKDLLEKLRTIGLKAPPASPSPKPAQESRNAPGNSNATQPAAKPA